MRATATVQLNLNDQGLINSSIHCIVCIYFIISNNTSVRLFIDVIIFNYNEKIKMADDNNDNVNNNLDDDGLIGDDPFSCFDNTS